VGNYRRVGGRGEALRKQAGGVIEGEEFTRLDNLRGEKKPKLAGWG